MVEWQKIAAGIIVLGVVTGTTLSPAQAGECPAFPRVSWWKGVNHDKVKAYVERKHQGDWGPYIRKWERQLDRMTKVRDRGKTAVIKSKRLRLRGEELADYVDQIAERLDITRCLAGEANRAAAIETADRDGRS